ncbi:MAG: ABC transporter substrate-binding protein [Methanothrix sp.]|nr:ABC transporter substrate-binding protein [Methanothrix sp.]
MLNKLLNIMIVAVLLTALVSTSALADSAAETKLIRLGYLPTTGHALTFVAKEQGFFADQDLDVELSQFPNSADGYNALTAGKLDVIAMGSTAPAVYISKGTDLKYIGGLMGEGAAAVTLADRASEFDDITAFKGKTIATVRMSTGDVVFRNAMHEAGIDWEKDVTIQELKSPSIVMDAVKTGKADVGIVWLPYQQIAETQGLKVILNSDTFSPEHPCCRFVVSTATLDSDRDSLVKFETALIQAYDYIKTNPDESVEDVQKYVDFDKTVIADSIFSEHFNFSPDPNKKAIEEWWEMMNTIGFISSDEDIDEHIDTSIYKEALDNLIAQQPDNENFQDLLEVYEENDE